MSEDTAEKHIGTAMRFGVILAVLVAAPVFSARWLNQWSAFDFPFGTLVLALGVPLALVLLTRAIPQDARAEEPEA